MTEPKRMMTPGDWNPRRVLVTGYYDGPTDGIIDFGDDMGVFCFEEVAFDNASSDACIETVARAG